MSYSDILYIFLVICSTTPDSMHLQVYCEKILLQDLKASHSYELIEKAQHAKNREEYKSSRVLHLIEENFRDLFKLFKKLTLKLK